MEEAGRSNIPTVEIGDHGNELGFGSIRVAVVSAMSRGATLCAASQADVVFLVMMSDWGCYGIEEAVYFDQLGRRLSTMPIIRLRFEDACKQP